MTWIIWAATLLILICGALVAHIWEIPGAAYWLAQCAGVIAAWIVVAWFLQLAMKCLVMDDVEEESGSK